MTFEQGAVLAALVGFLAAATLAVKEGRAALRAWRHHLTIRTEIERDKLRELRRARRIQQRACGVEDEDLDNTGEHRALNIEGPPTIPPPDADTPQPHRPKKRNPGGGGFPGGGFGLGVFFLVFVGCGGASSERTGAACELTRLACDVCSSSETEFCGDGRREEAETMDHGTHRTRKGSDGKWEWETTHEVKGEVRPVGAGGFGSEAEADASARRWLTYRDADMERRPRAGGGVEPSERDQIKADLARAPRAASGAASSATAPRSKRRGR